VVRTDVDTREVLIACRRLLHAACAPDRICGLVEHDHEGVTDLLDDSATGFVAARAHHALETVDDACGNASPLAIVNGVQLTTSTNMTVQRS
jgi:hypothetical protein